MIFVYCVILMYNDKNNCILSWMCLLFGLFLLKYIDCNWMFVKKSYIVFYIFF